MRASSPIQGIVQLRKVILFGSKTLMFCVAALASAFALANEPQAPVKKSDPEHSAADFIAQFYDVKPDLVTTKVVSREKNSASVVTSAAGQPDCFFEMAPAPETKKHGWLISGFTCDNVLDHDKISEWTKAGRPGATP